jgi:Protein of unknown function (DUF1566)
MQTRSIGALILLLVSIVFLSARADASICNRDRSKAADAYMKCRHKASTRFGAFPSDYLRAMAKCTAKYVARWPKIQEDSAGIGDACDGPRFVDNLDDTVTDNLTGLQWEKKTNESGATRLPQSLHMDGGRHRSERYGVPVPLLADLDRSGSCFVGECDWRMPSAAELQTILFAPFPCPTTSCINENLFGPTFDFPYWAAGPSDDPTMAWYVVFVSGGELRGEKTVLYLSHARGPRRAIGPRHTIELLRHEFHLPREPGS